MGVVLFWMNFGPNSLPGPGGRSLVTFEAFKVVLKPLDGEPGVHSAYYAGREGSREERDARNNAKLLASLGDERRAHYRCVMVLVQSADDPRPLVADGRTSLRRSALGRKSGAGLKCDIAPVASPCGDRANGSPSKC